MFMPKRGGDFHGGVVGLEDVQAGHFVAPAHAQRVERRQGCTQGELGMRRDVVARGPDQRLRVAGASLCERQGQAEEPEVLGRDGSLALLISETASRTPWQASFDARQTKACARNRAGKVHWSRVGFVTG